VSSFSREGEDRSNSVYSLTIVNPDTALAINDPVLNKQTQLRFWADKLKTISLGAMIVMDITPKDLGNLGDGTVFKELEIQGCSFRALMGCKRFSVQKANITLKNLVETIVTEGGIPYGVSSDMSYVTNLNDIILADIDFINYTGEEMLDYLFDYGVSWYVDHNKKIHIWDNTVVENAFLSTGYTVNDKSTLPDSSLKIGQSVGRGISNRIKVVGKPKKSSVITKRITGTGDPLDSLSFNLEYNPYIDAYRVEEWNDLDENEWNVNDTLGNIKTGHDGEGYIFVSEGKLVCWGGTGTLGDISVVKNSFFEYKTDGYLLSTFKINNNGMAYTSGLADGNGNLLRNIVAGFKVDNYAITKVVINGEEKTPLISVPLKRVIEGALTGLSTDRKSFDIDPAFAADIVVGNSYFINGLTLGLKYVKVLNKAGNTLTIDKAIGIDQDLADAYLQYDPWYNARILFKDKRLEFQIQGEDYGPIGSSIWTTIYSTTEDIYIPSYCFEFQVISEDLQCYFERLIVVPPETFSFVQDNGSIWTVAPQEYIESAACQVAIHPRATNGSPPRVEFLAALYSASVANNANNSLTRLYYIGKTQDEEFMTGDRIIVDGQEGYVLSCTPDPDVEGSGYIDLNPLVPLTTVPVYNSGIYGITTIYGRTTMLPAGVGGTLYYYKEIDNSWEFTEETSIATYGDIEGEAIVDDKLKDYTDLENRANAYFSTHAFPQVSGSFSFNICPSILTEPCFLDLDTLSMPETGQYFTVQSTRTSIPSTLVKISSVHYELLKTDIIKCNIVFNKDDYNEIAYQKQLNRRIVAVNERSRMLFQTKRNTDTFGLSEVIVSSVLSDSYSGQVFYGCNDYAYQ
jgi:hypothetical protein